jgi:Holliday junction resolvase RusA-like endonuclease
LTDDLFGGLDKIDTLAATIEIRMDGQPVGKGRPRFSRKSGTVYTPEKTARYEERLAWAAQSVMAGRPLLEGPLNVVVLAFMQIPASKSAKWKAGAVRGDVRPTSKPDADNLIKCLDSLNKVVWIDDSQIVQLAVSKHYSERPRLEISISLI